MSLFKHLCMCNTNTTDICLSKKHFCSCKNYDSVKKCMALKYHSCICKTDDFAYIYCKAVEGIHYCICNKDSINIFCKNHGKYDNSCICDRRHLTCTNNFHMCTCIFNIEKCISTDIHICMCLINNKICRSIIRHDCICDRSFDSCIAVLHHCICDNIYNIHLCKKCEKK